MHMDYLTRAILNNAQKEYDGGVIASVLDNVDLFNNSRVKVQVMSYLLSFRLTGGYVWGLVFGILWILILMAAMVTFCVMEYRRPRGVKAGRTRLMRISLLQLLRTKKDKMTKGGPREGVVPLVALMAATIPVVILLCLSIANVATLGGAISQPISNYNRSIDAGMDSLPSLRRSPAMLPGIQRSLEHARLFLSTVASNARRDTAGTVEDIIVATKAMQEDTSNRFNGLLMKRLGVTSTMTLGGKMANIVGKFFDHAVGLETARKDYDTLINELYPPDMDPSTGIFKLLTLLRDSVRHQLPSCEGECAADTDFFNKRFKVEREFANTDFARSFLFVMEKRNETKASVLAKSAHGRRQQEKMVAKTKKRMAELVDIAATVRNATASGWDKMAEQTSKAVAAIDKVLATLAGERATAAASRYSAIVVITLLVPVLLATIVLVLALLLACDNARSARIRLATYASLALLALSLMFATTTFLVGGKGETELCRYLRTTQPVVVSSNQTRSLILDQHINTFLAATLPRLARSSPQADMPIPSPHNLLYGLLHRCRMNEPLLVALDAIDSLNTSGLSKPETSAKILAVGRMLLLESLNATDPRKMMPADMEDSLKQASQMDMFKKIDIDDNIAKIPRSPIRERQGDNKTVMVSTHVFIDRVDKFLDTYGPQFKDQESLKVVKQEYAAVLLLLQRFNLVTDKARDLFRSLREVPAIGPVVSELQVSLASMLATMSDKPRLFEIANEFYDEHVVKTTPANSGRVMAKYGPKMMAQLARCRPLFDAYESSVDTVCDIVLPRLNVFWLYLGSIVLLLSLLLASVFLTLARTALPPPATDHLAPQADLALKQPLADSTSGDLDDCHIKSQL